MCCLSVVSGWGVAPIPLAHNGLSYRKQDFALKMGLLGLLVGFSVGFPPLHCSFKCSSLMQFPAHMFFFLFFISAFSLLWTIQAANTTHLQWCNIYHIFKSFLQDRCHPFHSTGQVCEAFLFLKGHNLKALHFLWPAFTRPMLAIGLHSISDIPGGRASHS